MNFFLKKIRPLACQVLDFLKSRKQKVKFFRLERSRIMEMNPDLELENRKVHYVAAASRESYGKLCSRYGMDTSALMLRRLDAGDVFAAIVNDSQVISSGWFAFQHRFWIAEADVLIDMADSLTCMLYDFCTNEYFRGKGFYRLLLQKMMTSRKDARAFMIYCNAENGASEKGIQKAGFAPVTEKSGKGLCCRHGQKVLTDLLEQEGFQVLGSNYRMLGLGTACRDLL